MRDRRRPEQKNKARQVVQSLSLDELHSALGRYCGPNNMLICQKKFGYDVILIEQDVNDEITDRIILGE